MHNHLKPITTNNQLDMKNSADQLQKQMIYMKFNNAHVSESCAITGQSFIPGIPLAFFLNGDTSKPVTPEIAIKTGFTIDIDDFDDLNMIVLHFPSYQSPQININLSLPVAMSVWMGLDELFRKAQGTEPGVHALMKIKKQIQGILFSALRNTKDFEHFPIEMGCNSISAGEKPKNAAAVQDDCLPF